MAILQKNPFQIIKQIFGGNSVSDEINKNGITNFVYADRKVENIQQQNIHTKLAYKIGGILFDNWVYSNSYKVNTSSSSVSNISIYDSFDNQNTDITNTIGIIKSLTIKMTDYSSSNVIPMNILYFNMSGQQIMESIDVVPSQVANTAVDIKLGAIFDPSQDIIIQVGHADTNTLIFSGEFVVSSK